VTAEAIGGVERFAALRLDAEAGLAGRRGGQAEREHDEDEQPGHDWWQGSWAIAPTPLRTMIIRKSRLPRTAARTKKWRRPCGAGSSCSTSRVCQSKVSAAPSASSTSAIPAAISAISQVLRSTLRTALAAPQRAIVTPKPRTSCTVQVSAAPRSPNHCRNSALKL